MKIATLFSGIGAPEVAANFVFPGNEIVFACEIDKFARQTYLANHAIDKKHFYKDIFKLIAINYQGKVYILVGGSPCQAFSLAGLRGGTDDERGKLIYEYIRVVNEVKAPVIVYENVKGLLSIDNGKTIKEFTQALRDIGYYCHYEVLNSKDYGTPQNRERLFLVGFLDSEAYYRFQFAPKQKLTKKLKDVLETKVDSKYYLSAKMVEGFKKHKDRHQEKGNGFAFETVDLTGPAKAITNPARNSATDNYIKQFNPNYKSQANAIHDTNKVAPTLCAFTHGYAGGFIKEPKSKVIGMLDIKGDDYIKRVYSVDGISPTLPTCQGGNQEPKILALRGRTGKDGITKQTAEYNSENISNALTCTQKLNMLDDGYAIRKLTPRECFRLQSFPDSFKIVVSDTQAYKQAGNSIDVNVLTMIFNQIKIALNSQTGYLLSA